MSDSEQLRLIAEQITEQMTGMGKFSNVDYYTANLRYNDMIIAVSIPRSQAVANGIEGIEDVVIGKLATWILSITNPQR